jgi:predicted nucleic-acid-binding Zn-ribbon protein
MNNQLSCPKCGSSEVKKLLYSSQGGFIWTPFLNFMKCRKCGTRFHGETGQLDPQVPKVMRIISVVIILGFIGLIVGLALSLPSLSERETAPGAPQPGRTAPPHE